jgi:hypothetical protein
MPVTLALAMLAAAAAPSVQAPAPARAQAQASGRIIQGARVVAGRSDLPARSGITFLKAEDGQPQLLRLVEFN